MTYPVLIRQENGEYNAKVVGMEGVEARAPSREEALEQLRLDIRELIASNELVELDIDEPKTKTPWEQIEKFKDDPSWDDLFDDIENRREADIR